MMSVYPVCRWSMILLKKCRSNFVVENSGRFLWLTLRKCDQFIERLFQITTNRPVRVANILAYSKTCGESVRDGDWHSWLGHDVSI